MPTEHTSTVGNQNKPFTPGLFSAQALTPAVHASCHPHWSWKQHCRFQILDFRVWMVLTSDGVVSRESRVGTRVIKTV